MPCGKSKKPRSIDDLPEMACPMGAAEMGPGRSNRGARVDSMLEEHVVKQGFKAGYIFCFQKHFELGQLIGTS